MDQTLDIFKELSVGGYVWVRTVTSIDEAREELSALSVDQPGSYLIYDPRRRTFVRSITNRRND